MRTFWTAGAKEDRDYELRELVQILLQVIELRKFTFRVYISTIIENIYILRYIITYWNTYIIPVSCRA